MTNVPRTATYLALVVILISGAPVALASEVTGNLSSDGSSRQTVPTQSRTATPTTQGDHSGSITGSVVGGRESNESGLTALVAGSQKSAPLDNILWWLMPFTALALITSVGFYFYAKQRSQPTR